MAQHDMIIDNGPGLAVRQDINAALNALVTVSAGPVEPATPYPGMLWLDTSVAPNGSLRQRKLDNTGWVVPAAGGLPLTGGTLTGDLTIDKATPTLVLNKPASGTNNLIGGRTNGKDRWVLALGSSEAESTGDQGSNFGLHSYHDDGSYNYSPLLITRSTQVMELRGLISAISGQIKFPATQNPSADPNTLDDYREGAWVPSLKFNGAAVGMTYSFQAGLWVKVGKLVSVTADFLLTNKGSSIGNALLDGLPFATANPGGAFAIWSQSMASLVDGTIGLPTGGTPSINLYTGSAAGNVALTQAHFTNTSRLNFFATYSAA